MNLVYSKIMRLRANHTEEIPFGMCGKIVSEDMLWFETIHICAIRISKNSKTNTTHFIKPRKIG